MKEQNKTVLAMLAAALANVIWGVGVVFSRRGLAVASPALLMLWRFLVAFAAMRCYAWIRRIDLRLRGRPWKYLLLMGIFEPGMYFAFEQSGILHTSATFAGIMLSLGPISSMFFGAIVLREMPTFRQILFSLVSIAGVVLLSVSPGSSAIATPLGAVLLLGAILSGSGYFITNRKISGEFTPFERTYSMAVLGVVFFFVWALLENIHHPAALIEALTRPGFAVSAVYLGLGSTAISYVLISYTATHLAVARSTVFNNVYTIVAILAGNLFLHEPLLPMLIPCTAMILVGVWGVQRFARDRMGRPKAE